MGGASFKVGIGLKRKGQKDKKKNQFSFLRLNEDFLSEALRNQISEIHQ